MFNRKYSGKYYVPTHRRRRPKHVKQQKLIIAVVAILCSIISCVSLAFLFTGTDPMENVFDNTYVACEVIENGPDENSPFDGETKTDVRIKNTGEVQSYIRAAVVVTWMSEDQSKVTAIKPEEGSDYEITYSKSVDESSNWVLGKDGYWYYTVPVSIDSETTNLIERCVCKVTPPDGYYLSVEIVASSIQSTPVSVVEEQWDSGISEVNGTTLVIKQ